MTAERRPCTYPFLYVWLLKLNPLCVADYLKDFVVMSRLLVPGWTMATETKDSYNSLHKKVYHFARVVI